jgi:hypothetical protein
MDGEVNHPPGRPEFREARLPEIPEGRESHGALTAPCQDEFPYIRYGEWICINAWYSFNRADQSNGLQWSAYSGRNSSRQKAEQRKST